MLARNKLNSIETLISQALTNSDISHEYTTIINEEEKYRRLKEDTRQMKSQSDAEIDKRTEEGKRTGINKIIRQNNEGI